jgi:ABC-type dipeptide/oligopeptide/nickel transport system permease subunit
MAATAPPIPDVLAGQLSGEGRTSLWRDTLGNILRQRNAVVGLTILIFFIVVAIFAEQIASHDPVAPLLGQEEGAKKLAGPCIHALGCPAAQPEHIFGIDQNVRDVFSRVVHGTRVSLQIGFLTVGFAIVIGTLIGAVSGYFGGATDNILMRLMDVVLAFPALLLAIAIVTVLGTTLINAQLAIGIVAIPIYARIMRASVLSIKERDYVTASQALGESGRGILVRRILPNALTPLIVQGTLGIAGAVIDVAALSFLGLGAQPPTAEWGSMIGQARNSMFAAPHLVIFPGVALALTVLAFNLLGDGLRDALDPRLNR